MSNLTNHRWLKPVTQASIDGVIAVVALALAFGLRYEDGLPERYAEGFALLLIGVSVGKTLISYLLGNYRRMWRYTSMNEVLVLAATAALAALALVGLRVLAPVEAVELSYGVIVIDAALYLIGVTGARLVRRSQVALFYGRQGEGDEAQERALFVGAGGAADALLRDLDHARTAPWEVVGLLDDDPTRQGRVLRGRRVLGPTTELERVVRDRGVQHVAVVMPSADEGVVRDLVRRARRMGVSVQVMPGVRSLSREKRLPAGGDGSAAVRLSDLADAPEFQEAPFLVQPGRPGDERPILVTGGAGYIGSHLTRKLLGEGHRVRVLDNFTFGKRGLEELAGHPRLELVEGDISNIRDVTASVKDAGAVIALAAIVGDPACGLNAEETLNLNYESTKVLVEACDFYGVDRLVFASSCSVYGASDEGLLTETSSLNPVSLYARTRIMSEDVILDRCGRVTPVILRLATVFGLSPRMRFDLVVNTLTVRAVTDGRFQIFGGDQWRPFVHCQDAAEAFLRAATAPKERVDREVFNVGTEGMNYTIAEVGGVVAEEVERRRGPAHRRRGRPAELPRRLWENPRAPRLRAAVRPPLGHPRDGRGHRGQPRPPRLRRPDLLEPQDHAAAVRDVGAPHPRLSEAPRAPAQTRARPPTPRAWGDVRRGGGAKTDVQAHAARFPAPQRYREAGAVLGEVPAPGGRPSPSGWPGRPEPEAPPVASGARLLEAAPP